jgi:putative phosphoribosyl transferase
MRFRDRRDAGRRLARAVAQRAPADPVVLALPRGGVPVAFEVAAALGAPLDVLVVRKLGAPDQPELAVGALAEGGFSVVDRRALAALRIGSAEVDALVARESEELARRVTDYRGDRPPVALAGRTVVVVDDGLATGASARVALAAVRARGPAAVLFAAPVCASDAPERLSVPPRDVICVLAPDDLVAVGRWYRDFAQVDDATVRDLLAQAAVDRLGG